MNERITRIRERALRGRLCHDDERDALRQESFAETEGEPAVTREAKAFAHHCRKRTIVIREDELLVGSPASIEYDSEAATKREIFGRQPFRCHWPVSDETQAFFREGFLSPAGNHTTLDYETVLTIGFDGIVERIDERLGRLDGEPDAQEKREFLEALKIVAEGYVDFCRRHADHALELAATIDDPARKAELEAIAEACRRVPAQPPRSFREACQSLWFCFFFLPDAPGRVDQYLNPFYQKDLAECAITPEDARELLGCLWIKYLENAGVQSAVSAINHLTLGGVKPDGSDASNDVTWLCLDVTEDLRLNRPQVGSAMESQYAA